MIGAETGDYFDLNVGCMPCVNRLQLQANYAGVAGVRQEVTGVPVTEGNNGHERASCGIQAMDGVCPNADIIEVLAELIREGEIEGVRVADNGK